MMVMGCCSNYSTLSHVARGASSRLAPALYRNKNFQVVTIQPLFAEGRLAAQGALKIRVCQYIKYIIYPPQISTWDVWSDSEDVVLTLELHQLDENPDLIFLLNLDCCLLLDPHLLLSLDHMKVVAL